MHVSEYTSLFPHLAPLTTKYRDEQVTQKHLANLRSRFGYSLDITAIMLAGEAVLPIKAFFVFHDVGEMEESLQIATDLLISKDGVPGSVREVDERQVVELYTTNPDFGKLILNPRQLKAN